VFRQDDGHISRNGLAESIFAEGVLRCNNHFSSSIYQKSHISAHTQHTHTHTSSNTCMHTNAYERAHTHIHENTHTHDLHAGTALPRGLNADERI